RINDLALSLIGMPADDVMLAPPGSVLKTSSGKIRRAASREVYERGGSAGTRSVWLQVARLTCAAILPQVKRSLRAAGDLAYGAYALVLLGTIGAAVWIACAALPRGDWCWRFSHRAARTFLWLTGMAPVVRGLEHLPSGRASMIAVNHASYLDGVVLVAALAEPKYFVAKRELLDHWVPRIFLTAIGAVFVDRFDAQRGVEDAGRFVDAARGAKWLVGFPEGTWRPRPGLRPFRMGAFVIAAQAGVPIVPVTLRGTRSALRDGQWLFRRSRLGLTVSTPIEPAGDDWNAAIKLRDATPAQILPPCRAPHLAQ